MSQLCYCKGKKQKYEFTLVRFCMNENLLPNLFVRSNADTLWTFTNFMKPLCNPFLLQQFSMDSYRNKHQIFTEELQQNARTKKISIRDSINKCWPVVSCHQQHVPTGNLRITVRPCDTSNMDCSELYCINYFFLLKCVYFF